MQTSEIKPGLYDFDEYGRRPVSFHYCQAGFHPDGAKPLIVWTRREYPTGSAWLINVSARGSRVQLPLNLLGLNIWGRQEWLVDMSSVDREGVYVVAVEFEGDSAETSPITVSRHLYESIMEKTAKHFFLKRCGIWCHTHDADMRSLDNASFGRQLGHVDVTGGWHDAHDDNKWVVYTWMPLYSLLKAHELFDFKWKHANEPLPALLAEAWWEIGWLLRMQKPDGSFYAAVTEWHPGQSADGAPSIQVHHHEQNYDSLHQDHRALLDIWGDGLLCRLCGFSYGCFPSTAPKYFAYLAHVLCMFARLVEKHDSRISGLCRAAAGKTVGYLENLPELPPYQELETRAGLALYYLECARHAGDSGALEKAEHYLEAILAMQQASGCFHSSMSCRGLEAWPEEAGDERVYVDCPFGYVFPIIEYLDMAGAVRNNAFQLEDKARSALFSFAKMLAGFCSATSFRQPTEIRFDREPMIIPNAEITHHGYNPYILSAGIVFCAAARLAGFPEGLELGERQFHWVLGANPRFMSFVNCLGERNSGQYAACATEGPAYEKNKSLMAFYRQIRDLRWGVTVGIYGSKQPGGNDRFRRPDMVFPQPPNYPNAGQSMNGKYDNMAQETWNNSTGWLLMLAAELQRNIGLPEQSGQA